MPSENSAMDDITEVDETNGFHAAGHNIGSIYRMKQGAVPNGECVDSASSGGSSMTSILKKKTKRKEGNKRSPEVAVETFQRRLVRLAPKAPTNDTPALSYTLTDPRGTYVSPMSPPAVAATPSTSMAGPSGNFGLTAPLITTTLPSTVTLSTSRCSPAEATTTNVSEVPRVCPPVPTAEPLRTGEGSGVITIPRLVSPLLPGRPCEPPADVVARQLTSHVLPPFAPTNLPPARFALRLPPDGHQCRDCHDRFLLPDSLDQHYRRRSVFISFDCGHCPALLHFYNRCALLAHVRDHHERGQTLADVRHATLTPLPHELVPAVQDSSAHIWERAVMGFLGGGLGGACARVNVSVPNVSAANVNVPNVSAANVSKTRAADDHAGTVRPNGTKTVIAPVVRIAPASPIMAAPVVSTMSTSVMATASTSEPRSVEVRYRCSECQQTFTKENQFRRHFNGDQPDGSSPTIDSNLQCQACSMMCTTRCSLSAHRRSHVQRRPFVCPECGQHIGNTWAAFQRHVTLVCFHPSRTVGFECPQCASLSATPDRLRRHLETKHEVTSFVKCMACPMAFKNREAFRLHRQEAHDEDESVRCGVIFKCPLCEVVFQKEGGLRDHLKGHFNKLGLPLKMAKYLFRCPECNELFLSKTLVARHVNDTHPHLIAPGTKAKKSVTASPSTKVAQIPDGGDDTVTKAAGRRRGPKGAAPKANAVAPARRGRKRLSADDHEPMDLENGERSVNNDEEGEDEDGGTLDANQELNGPAGGGDGRPKPSSIKKFQCDKCGCSFRTKHWSRVHAVRCKGVEGPRQLWCAVCEEEMADDDGYEMAEHGQSHLAEGTLVCTLCHNLPFTSKVSLARHIENHALRYDYPYTCVFCQEELPDIGKANLHWRGEHGLQTFVCPMCDVHYLSTKSLGRHVRDVHGDDSRSTLHFSCAFCLMEFPTVAEANDHVEHLHEIAADRVNSHMVKRIFRNPLPVRKKKIVEEDDEEAPPLSPHDAAADDSPNSTPARSPPTKRSRPPHRPPPPSLPPIPKLTIKIEPPDGDETPGSDVRTGGSPKPKRPRLTIVTKPRPEKKQEEYRCAKCDHVDTDRARFVDHLRTAHRTSDAEDDEDDAGIQCLECGISFAVAASLRRHLIFSHRVRDVDKFLRDKGYEQPAEIEAIETVPEVGDSAAPEVASPSKVVEGGEASGNGAAAVREPNPLECQVCGVCFDNEMALKVHGRTHGMAFIRSKFTNVTRGGAAATSTVATTNSNAPELVSPAKSSESS